MYISRNWLSQRPLVRICLAIPYFTAYLIYYFYNLKTSGDRQKQTTDSESKIEKYM